jgi:hypothetical protein
LRFGPITAPPRYAPGFPLLLAVALRAGVPPVHLRDVVVLADGAVTFLVALLAGQAVPAVRRALGVAGDPGRESLAGVAAAGVCGAVAGFSKWSVVGSSLLASDVVCLLAGAITLLAWCRVFAGEPGRRGAAALAAVAGAGFAWTCAIRTVEGALLAPVLAAAPFVLRSAPVRRLRAALPAFALGAAVPAGLVALLLVRSGRSPTEWSAYAFWVPWIAEPGVAFSSRHLFASAFLPEWPGWRLLTSLVFGLPAGYELGILWPALAWIAAGVVWWRLRRRSGGRTLRGVIALLGLWSATHCLVYPFYFYPATRFYLVATQVVTLFGGAAVGLGVAHGRRAVRLVALAAGVAVAWLSVSGWWGLTKIQSRHRQGAAQESVERELERWRRMRPEVRRTRRISFDLLQAQALGHFDEETVARIRVWGLLPRDSYVLRLNELDLVPRKLLDRRPASRRAPSPYVEPVFRDGFERGDLEEWTFAVSR